MYIGCENKKEHHRCCNNLLSMYSVEVGKQAKSEHAKNWGESKRSMELVAVEQAQKCLPLKPQF